MRNKREDWGPKVGEMKRAEESQSRKDGPIMSPQKWIFARYEKCICYEESTTTTTTTVTRVFFF